MPAMTGIELCRKMIESGRSLPTILISGRDDPQTRKIIREAKPIASLLKPFDEKSLLRAIRKSVARSFESSQLKRRQSAA